jgi:hypothetical protein
MKVSIELTEDEIEYLFTCGVLRVMKSAEAALPDDYEYLDEVKTAGIRYENIRGKLTAAIRSTLTVEVKPP